MKRFARLIDDLAFCPTRDGKLRLLSDYFAGTPDPDRGWGMAALTGSLVFQTAKPSLIRTLAAARVDPVLFALSYDFVGDLAETVALIWPARTDEPSAPARLSLTEVATGLRQAPRTEMARLVEGWLDRLDAGGRMAALKLITGGLRADVSARLAKSALAEWSGGDIDHIEALWHGLAPPYESLFAWLEKRGPAPVPTTRATLRPFMLANPLAAEDMARLDPRDFRAEWKWDGIRVQLVALDGERRLFGSGGDDIGDAFPEITAAMTFDAVLDGEVLVVRAGTTAPFADLQQRLNRKRIDAKLRAAFPVAVRLYDLLAEGDTDLRPLAYVERRRRLEAWFARVAPPAMTLAPTIAFETWSELASLRTQARTNGTEGLMVKRADSPYVAGRAHGHWYQWKRAPLTVDAVLLYAQRGQGGRSSLYSDFTFGVWRSEVLVPIGKADSGVTDEDLLHLDRWIRTHTVQSFGPVRAVTPGLVLEVAFDGVQRSIRHKSGLVLRFPRIQRIRWDKAPADADRLEALERWVVGDGAAPSPAPPQSINTDNDPTCTAPQP